MTFPGIEDKVAFLSRPEAYPDRAHCVDTIQTHMSWVFLTDTHAWKLKKPVRNQYLDFSTPEARRRNCAREIRLNQRLTNNVYLKLVPLTVNKLGKLQLGGRGKTIDSLVRMRRLPSDRMLDDLIARHAVGEEDIRRLANVLSAFYRNADPTSMTGKSYRKLLSIHLEDVRHVLARTDYRLPTDLVESIICSQLEFLEENAALFDARIQARKIIDAHGDLRPEHICLEPRPVVIDCLEFNRKLRTLDIASELMFLELECERLGNSKVGRQIFKRYSEATGDRPHVSLLDFYKRYHACVRAKIAIWHLQDESIEDGSKWIAKANRYLSMAGNMRLAA
jgi:aminoglycoside phosphotransferase family enzyme